MDLKEYTLDELLPYEQPTKYIVESTKYDDSYKTPVLTAGKSFILGYTNETEGIFEKDKLPVIIFDDFTTASKFVNFQFKVKSSAMKILRVNTNLVLPKYIFYRLQMIQVDHYTHKRYWIQQYSKMKIQIPDLEMQAQIVNKIEEIYSQIDEGVCTLNQTSNMLKIYTQSVLKSAFEGKFTQSWREINKEDIAQELESISIQGVDFKDTSGDENEMILDFPKEWKKVRFGSVFDVQVGATPSRKEKDYWNGDINWISSGEVKFNTIYHTDESITQLGLDNSSTNVHPVGTVMLAMIGEGKTRGQAAILNIPAAHNQNTAAILVSKTKCSPKYIYYFLQMNYDNTRRVGSGNNQKALNKERVKAIRFPFCSFGEQKAIVDEIEKRLSVCESIEKTIENALVQADALKFSSLKKIFEGRFA